MPQKIGVPREAMEGETMEPQGKVTPLPATETAELLKEAKSVILVPGYGMTVAQTQHTVFETWKAKTSIVMKRSMASGYTGALKGM